jgi:hypothetical protein
MDETSFFFVDLIKKKVSNVYLIEIFDYVYNERTAEEEIFVRFDVISDKVNEKL